MKKLSILLFLACFVAGCGQTGPLYLPPPPPPVKPCVPTPTTEPTVMETTS